MASRYTSGERKGKKHRPKMGFPIIRDIYGEVVADYKTKSKNAKMTKKQKRRIWDKITLKWE